MAIGDFIVASISEGAVFPPEGDNQQYYVTKMKRAGFASPSLKIGGSSISISREGAGMVLGQGTTLTASTSGTPEQNKVVISAVVVGNTAPSGINRFYSVITPLSSQAAHRWPPADDDGTYFVTFCTSGFLTRFNEDDDIRPDILSSDLWGLVVNKSNYIRSSFSFPSNTYIAAARVA